MSPKLNDQDLKERLHRKASRVSDKDVEDLLRRQQEIEEKLKTVAGPLKKMVNQLKLLFEMVKDYSNGTYREIPWYTIAMAVAAIVYFLSPIDVIPDFIPGVGYVDDAAVILLTIKAIQEDLKAYCAFKGYSPAQYF